MEALEFLGNDIDILDFTWAILSCSKLSLFLQGRFSDFILGKIQGCCLVFIITN